MFIVVFLCVLAYTKVRGVTDGQLVHHEISERQASDVEHTVAITNKQKQLQTKPKQNKPITNRTKSNQTKSNQTKPGRKEAGIKFTGLLAG